MIFFARVRILICLFEMSDPDNRRLRIKPYQNLIMIVLGTIAKQADQMFRLIEERINHNK